MMEDNKFRGRYRIPSARAQWHNYDGGEYFVTICTRDREHYFGEIAGGKMHLSEMGMVADKCMRDIHNHFPHVDVPSYVIMPNHVHAIIVIDRTKMGIPIEEPQNFAALQSSQQSESLQKFGPQRRNLASVVRGFKIGVTKYARQNNITFAWQTRSTIILSAIRMKWTILRGTLKTMWQNGNQMKGTIEQSTNLAVR